jgi:hypothetical protein
MRMENGWRAQARAVGVLLIVGTVLAIVAALCGGCVTDPPYQHVYTATEPPVVGPFRPIEDGPLPRAVSPNGAEDAERRVNAAGRTEGGGR